MKYFIFRNQTIELLFSDINASFSGYNDISYIDETADRFIWFYLTPIKVDNKVVADEINNDLSSLKFVLQQIPPTKEFFIFSLYTLFDIQIELSENTLKRSIDFFNSEILQLARQHSNIRIIDANSFFSRYRSNEIIDWKYYFISKMIISPRLTKDFKKWFSGEVSAIELKRKKCIIVDLDNTLWGGILGEDGEEGIKLGGDYPGSAFLLFQEYLLELNKKGVLLAVCSKNNETDVFDVWKNHPLVILKEEHFAAYKINWNNKAENIKQLADELNLGLDSFVFIDDNATERELVKQLLPAVTVPDFPEQPYMLPQFMQELVNSYFKLYKLTSADKNKTQQYKENLKRTNFQQQFSNIDDYLQSLNIALSIRPADKYTMSRLAQLTQKTNQFNLTTFRYTETDILSQVKNGSYIYSLSVKDRFGDSGITGVCIIKFEGGIAIIDTFLMSCRILGKGIEKAFLLFCLQQLQQKGVNTVLAKYISTPKNSQVKDFFDKNGFVCLKDSLEEKVYKMDGLQNQQLIIDSFYKIN